MYTRKNLFEAFTTFVNDSLWAKWFLKYKTPERRLGRLIKEKSSFSRKAYTEAGVPEQGV